MSISSNAIRKAGPFSGNGVTVAFPFTFKVFQQSDVLVVLTDSLGNQVTQTLTTNYTVSLNANQDNNPGGTVTMLAAPATGYTLVIGSQVSLTQPTVLTNNGGMYPSTINDSLDRATIQVQQLAEAVSRMPQFPISDPALNTQMPSAAQRANTLLAFDASGNIVGGPNIASVGTVTTNISNINTAASNIASINTAAANIAAIQVAPANAINAAASASAAAASALAATNTPVAVPTHAAASKATPVAADEIPLIDSASGFTLLKLTISNLFKAIRLANYADDTGAVNAYVVNRAIPATAYFDGMTVELSTVNTNTISAFTVNVDGLGAVNATLPGGSAIPIRGLLANAVNVFKYNSTGPRLELQNVGPSTTKLLYTTCSGFGVGALRMTTKVFDTLNEYNPATGVFVPLVSGFYDIAAQYSGTASGGNSSYLSLTFGPSSSTYPQLIASIRDNFTNSVNSNTGISLSGLVEVTAGVPYYLVFATNSTLTANNDSSCFISIARRP